jgi:hypothetical protein
MYSLFFDEKIKFQYPPSALLPLDLFPRSMTAIAVRMQLDARLAFVLRWMSILAVVTTILVSVAILLHQVGRYAPDILRSPMRIAAFVALGSVLSLTWYPLLIGYMWGQIQVFLNLLIALCIFFYVLGWRVTGGMCLGLCCLVKPHYGIVLLWSLLRRRWDFAAGFAIVVALGLGAALVRYGFSEHLNYLSVIMWISERGESIWVNQSLNALLHRWLGNGSPVEIPGEFQSSFPPYHRLVHLLSTINTLVILALGLFFLRKDVQGGSPLDLATVVVAVSLASPIAWMHQYGAFLPVFALAMAGLAGMKPPARVSALLLALSFLMMGQVVLRWDWFFESPLKGLLGSHVFFAGLVLFGVLLYLRWRPAAKPS